VTGNRVAGHRRLQALGTTLRPVLAIALLLSLSIPCLLLTRPAHAQTYRYTITTPPGTAVTMGDPVATVPITITNDPTSSASIDYVRLWFPASAYDLSSSTIAPTGWQVTQLVNAGAGNTFIVFETSTAPIPPGASLTFDVVLTGDGDANIPAAASDQTDALEQSRVRAGTRTFTDPPSLPTWQRLGLAVDILAIPPSVGVNGLIDVTMRIANRSTAGQVGITSTLAAAGSGGVARLSGPMPAALAVPAGESGIITYTYRATAAGQVNFSGSAANAAVTSLLTESDPVVIGDFTALIQVLPETIIAGQELRVRMTVQNNSPIALGNVRPSSLTLIGTASVDSFSGPKPPVVPSVGAGESTTFEWTYVLTGTVGSTYAFSGYAIANGPLTTNVARSNEGSISVYGVTVAPNRIGSGAPTPVTLAFSVSNNGGTDVDEVVIGLPTGWGYQSASGGYGGAWRVSTVSGEVRFTVQGGSGLPLPPGESADFYVVFNDVPEVTADTTYNFPVTISSGSGASRTVATVEALVTVTAYRLQVSAQPSTIPADGSSTSVITATLTSGSAPVPGAVVSFFTTQGTLSAPTATTDAGGTATVRLTAPSSSTTTFAYVEATYLNAQAQTVVTCTGYTGPNPLYVGGTLAPLSVEPGDTVAFSLAILNVGNQPITLTAASTFSFSDGTHTCSAVLSTPTPVPANEQRTLTFTSAPVDAAFEPGLYQPALHLVGSLPGQVVDRLVSDRVSVGVAVLVVNMAAVPTAVSVGQPITVTAVVTNEGSTAAEDVTAAVVVNGPGSLVSGPVPPSVATLAPGSATAFTWVYTGTAAGTVNWTGSASGTDANTGIVVFSLPHTSNDVTVLRPAQLVASLVGVPPTVNVGQAITVTMRVTNTGQTAASDVAPSPLAMSGTGGAVVASGPQPPSVPLLPGGAATGFVWTYTASAVGTVNWNGTVSGTDASGGWPVTAVASPASVEVQAPASLACSIAALPTPVDTGATVTVTMTITNSGGATASAVSPSALTMQGDGGASLSGGPAPPSADIPGGTSGTFMWTYTATAAGEVRWSGSAAGWDANSGAPVLSPPCSSGVVQVEAAAYLVAALAAAPDAIGLSELVTVTMLVTNTGTLLASDVTPSSLVFDATLFPTLVSGPVPPSTDIAGGDSVAFVWVYRSASDQTGSATWSGFASGDGVDPTPVVTSNPVTVYEVLPDKSVQRPRPGSVDPGEVVTYTITIRNTGSSRPRLQVVTDTLPADFVYQGDVGYSTCTPSSSPPLGQSGTLTWQYSPFCRLEPDESVTISFLASAAPSPGEACNAVSFWVRGADSPVSRTDLACVVVAWPEYLITTQAGSQLIQARVRMVGGQPVILSWEILR
jgi:uncharacterized repeat protein (TIGR01451 family)